MDAVLAIRTAHEGDEGCDAFREASLLLNRLFCAGNRTAGRLLHHLLESGEAVRAVHFHALGFECYLAPPATLRWDAAAAPHESGKEASAAPFEWLESAWNDFCE